MSERFVPRKYNVVRINGFTKEGEVVISETPVGGVRVGHTLYPEISLELCAASQRKCEACIYKERCESKE